MSRPLTLYLFVFLVLFLSWPAIHQQSIGSPSFACPLCYGCHNRYLESQHTRDNRNTRDKQACDSR